MSSTKSLLDVPLSVVVWLRIASWLAVIGGVVVFTISDWGIVFTILALILAFVVLSSGGEHE